MPVLLFHLRRISHCGGKHYEVPLEVMRKLQIPFVNFGPDGKDPHKYSERIELNYSLKQAPRLRKMLVDEMMRD